MCDAAAALILILSIDYCFSGGALLVVLVSVTFLIGCCCLIWQLVVVDKKETKENLLLLPKATIWHLASRNIPMRIIVWALACLVWTAPLEWVRGCLVLRQAQNGSGWQTRSTCSADCWLLHRASILFTSSSTKGERVPPVQLHAAHSYKYTSTAIRNKATKVLQ